jgi:hypothetical protein
VFNGEVHPQPKSMPQQDLVEMLTGDALPGEELF